MSRYKSALICIYIYARYIWYYTYEVSIKKEHPVLSALWYLTDQVNYNTVDCVVVYLRLFCNSIMSAEEIANAFITHYYTTLDSNPSQLAGLYVSLTYCDRAVFAAL